MAVWRHVPSFRWGIVVKQDSAEALGLIGDLGETVGLIAGLVVVPVFLFALLVARSISRPIEQAVQLAEQVAAGDLRAQVETTGRGETYRLLTAIDAMTRNLNSLIGRVQQSAGQLLAASNRTESTSRKQEQAIKDFGTSTTEISAAVNQISATSEELLRTVNAVSKVAVDTAKVAEAGRQKLNDMQATMGHLALATHDFDVKLQEISGKASGVTKVVTTITQLADQTNLLSVNATIEAEKAGEAGRGFRVVAREIRRLADQTAAATLDIESMIDDVQSAIATGTTEMARFHAEVVTGLDQVTQIGQQLGQIIEPVQALTDQFAQVNEGMRSQSEGARQIRDAMLQLTDGARQSEDSLRQFRIANREMIDAVGGLDQEVSRFKLST